MISISVTGLKGFWLKSGMSNITLQLSENAQLVANSIQLLAISLNLFDTTFINGIWVRYKYIFEVPKLKADC